MDSFWGIAFYSIQTLMMEVGKGDFLFRQATKSRNISPSLSDYMQYARNALCSNNLTRGHDAHLESLPFSSQPFSSNTMLTASLICSKNNTFSTYYDKSLPVPISLKRKSFCKLSPEVESFGTKALAPEVFLRQSLDALKNGSPSYNFSVNKSRSREDLNFIDTDNHDADTVPESESGEQFLFETW